MRLLITLTILLFSFTIQAQDDPCKKAEDALKLMNDYNAANNIDSNDIQPILLQVMSAADDNRNGEAVLKSMYDNKTIDVKMYTAATYAFLYIRYAVPCEGFTE